MMTSDISKIPSVKTIQAIRERSSKFVNDREWNKFHLPASLSLALAGECGEICEIFQWKGNLDGNLNLEQVFSEKEMINIGEEIADVFIYSTRLCEICNLDLAYSIQLKNAQIDTLIDSTHIHRPGSLEWNHLPLDELSSLLSTVLLDKNSFRSQRQVALSIQNQVGKVCDLFTRYPEQESMVGLPSWSSSDLASLSSYLAAICLLLAILAYFTKHSLAQCISDKFLKNEKKYPVELAKGSCAKYTEYAESIAKSNNNNIWNASNNNNGKLKLVVSMAFIASVGLGFILSSSWFNRSIQLLTK